MGDGASALYMILSYLTLFLFLKLFLKGIFVAWRGTLSCIWSGGVIKGVYLVCNNIKVGGVKVTST